MQLAKLIRKKVVVLGPGLFSEARLNTVTLVGVEAAGIWVQSDEAMNRIAEQFRVRPAARAAFFIPFAQITSIIASGETEGEESAGGEAAGGAV